MNVHEGMTEISIYPSGRMEWLRWLWASSIGVVTRESVRQSDNMLKLGIQKRRIRRGVEAIEGFSMCFPSTSNVLALRSVD